MYTPSGRGFRWSLKDPRADYQEAHAKLATSHEVTAARTGRLRG
jgi:hypothetical protein